VALVTGRPRRATWLPVAVAWVSSGTLTAWSAWKLPLVAVLATDPGVTDQPWPEDLGLAAAQYAIGVVAGLAMVATLRRATAGAQRLEHVIAN
jgi:hypothetical protein